MQNTELTTNHEVEEVQSCDQAISLHGDTRLPPSFIIWVSSYFITTRERKEPWLQLVLASETAICTLLHGLAHVVSTATFTATASETRKSEKRMRRTFRFKGPQSSMSRKTQDALPLARTACPYPWQPLLTFRGTASMADFLEKTFLK